MFVLQGQKPAYLFCYEAVSVNKDYNFGRHLEKQNILQELVEYLHTADRTHERHSEKTFVAVISPLTESLAFDRGPGPWLSGVQHA